MSISYTNYLNSICEQLKAIIIAEFPRFGAKNRMGVNMNKILKKYIWIAEGLVMVATLIFSIFDLRLMFACIILFFMVVAIDVWLDNEKR